MREREREREGLTDNKLSWPSTHKTKAQQQCYILYKHTHLNKFIRTDA